MTHYKLHRRKDCWELSFTNFGSIRPILFFRAQHNKINNFKTKRMKNTSSTTFQLYVSGLLIVKLPILLLMLISFICLISFTSSDSSKAMIISLIIGWTYWEFSSRFWIKWALKRNFEKDELYKIGNRSLILWPKDKKKIDKIAAQLSNKNNL